MSLIKEIYITDTLDPFYNLAVEEYLLKNLPPDTTILYLWRNENTVVIGKNQNAWRECRTGIMEKEGCRLVRRTTGGGAVYHDSNNINFTFLLPREQYNYRRQAQVIIDAVAEFGIEAEINGRNDIVTGGFKFSGNAFTFTPVSACHHGTLLLKTDTEKMARYLEVSPEKLSAKGIKSVKSRVINLCDINPDITVEGMTAALCRSFEKNYGKATRVYTDASHLDKNALDALWEKYLSYEFRYGETPDFDITLENRFNWGSLELNFKVKEGIIVNCIIFTDALDVEFIDALSSAFIGRRLIKRDLSKTLSELGKSFGHAERCIEISKWLESREF